MALYLISYDIAERNREEYQELWDYLDSLGSQRILYSQYAVPFNGKAIDLANRIQPHVRTGDRLFVSELFDGGTCAWINLRISTEAFRKLLTDYARRLG
ncbi:MAG TPA: hypothetical protein VMT53_14860 [Terriglobales bacterium]|nr:hypothetical protein [Terriglobales bacterium]